MGIVTNSHNGVSKRPQELCSSCAKYIELIGWDKVKKLAGNWMNIISPALFTWKS